MSTTLHVLRSFLVILPDRSVDASQIHSVSCYHAWLASRNAQDCDAERKKFHRSLTNHLSGVDGRCPFDPHEEDAILAVLRRKERWPCFPDLPIGINFRAKGFHEKQRSNAALAAGGGSVLPAAPAALLQPPPPPPRPDSKRHRLLNLEPKPRGEEEETAASPAAASAAASSSSSSTVPASVASRAQLTQEETTLLFNLGQGFANFTLAFAPFGIDVRRSIFGILRFCLVFRDAQHRLQSPAASAASAPAASSPPRPSSTREQQLEHARRIVADTERAKGGEACVLVCDCLGSDQELFRVVLQNDACVRRMGAGLDGNSVLDMLHFGCAQDLYDLIQTLACAYLRPGTEFELPPGVSVGANSTDVPVKCCWLDAESGLMVGVAQSEDESSSSSSSASSSASSPAAAATTATTD